MESLHILHRFDEDMPVFRMAGDGEERRFPDLSSDKGHQLIRIIQWQQLHAESFECHLHIRKCPHHRILRIIIGQRIHHFIGLHRDIQFICSRIGCIAAAVI